MNSDTGFNDPTGYHDDGDDSKTGFGKTQTEVAPKKKSKAPLVVFGVLFGALILTAGYFVFAGKSTPAPAPTPTTTPVDGAGDGAEPVAADPTIDAAADPFAATPDQGAAAGIDPLTGLPLEAAPTIDPLTGLPVVQQSADPFAAPTGQPAPQVQPQGIDPLTGLPTVAAVDPATGLPSAPAPQFPGAPQQQPVQQTAIDPATGLPVLYQGGTPAPVTTPSADPFANQPAQPAPAQPTEDIMYQAPQYTQAPSNGDVGVSNAIDPLAQFRDMLAPIDGRVTTLEGRVNRLSSTVSRIEKRLDDRPASSPARRAAPAPARRANSVRVEPSIRVEPPVSRVVISDGRASSDQYVAPAQGGVNRSSSCDVQAIVQGRVWVKGSDGNFSSYGEGDAWTNGRTIESIDPQRGVLAGGQWVCGQ